MTDLIILMVIISAPIIAIILYIANFVLTIDRKMSKYEQLTEKNEKELLDNKFFK